MKRSKSIWPPPVYVAQFAQGETVRMSIHAELGKPWRFSQIRKGVCQIVGNERARGAAPLVSVSAGDRATRLISSWPMGNEYQPAKPATDLTIDYIEYDGREWVEGSRPGATAKGVDNVSKIRKLIEKLTPQERGELGLVW